MEHTGNNADVGTYFYYLQYKNDAAKPFQRKVILILPKII